MRAARTAWWASAILLFILTFVCLNSTRAQVTVQPDTNADVAVIVHRDNPLNNLSLSELRRIYMGERQYWKANVPVSVLIRTPGSREREVVLREIFKMNEAQYKQYWVGKIMRAESTSAPIEVYSNGMTKEGIASLAGGIGCVLASDVRAGVKVLRIDGHLPGEAAYPLR
jgi:ABC-type phosphate transport system substrate-binding protein